jgi:hypothetical protein
MSTSRRSALLHYGVAVVATILATSLRHLLDPVLEDAAPFTAYFLAIMFTAWYGGLGLLWSLSSPARCWHVICSSNRAVRF